MSAVESRQRYESTVSDKGVERVCVECGETFVDPRRSGAPRSYCDDCRAPKRTQLPQPKPIAGRPFTVAHFKRWANRLVLPDGKRLRVEKWEERFVDDVLSGRFKECWLVVPEGNGKSTLVALLVVYAIEFSEFARIPVAASSRDQASIIYTQAQGFIRRTPELQLRFNCQKSRKEIEHGDSFAKIYAADANTGDGIIPHPFEILDELHRHRDLELYRTWAGKLDKEDALLIAISTAGEPGSEFEEVREQIRQSASSVERGVCFGRYAGRTVVMHEYAVPDGGDLDDLKLVKAANPSRRVTLKSLREKRERPSYALAHWSRLTCNVATRSESAAISEIEWAAATVDAGIPLGAPVTIGLDVGWIKDPTAIVPLFVRDVEWRQFGPTVVLEPPSDGTSLDPHDIERALSELAELYSIEQVVMDQTRAEAQASWIEEHLGCPVVARTQSIPMQVLDFKRFTEALRHGWLKHSGCPNLTRHVLNAHAQLLPGGDLRFVRPRESRTTSQSEQRRRRIDALVAAAMAHTTASTDDAREEFVPWVKMA